MARKASRAGDISALAHPEDRRDAARRARVEVRFDEQAMLGALFGQFDANLVQVENRLGVFISARGDRVQIEGSEDSVARARDTLQAMYDRLALGQQLESGAIEGMIAMSVEPTLEGIVRGGGDDPGVMIRTRRKTIVPRSAGQIPYMKQLAGQDIIVALGQESRDVRLRFVRIERLPVAVQLVEHALVSRAVDLVTGIDDRARLVVSDALASLGYELVEGVAVPRAQGEPND